LKIISAAVIRIYSYRYESFIIKTQKHKLWLV